MRIDCCRVPAPSKMEARYRAVRGGDASDLGALLPVGLVAVEALGDVAPDPLLAGEAAVVANAIERRQHEFARGRTCVHRAMALLGIEPAPVVNGPDRAPIWPAGMRGSITHCDNYACAVVGRAEAWSAIGIDAELVQTLAPEIVDEILLDSERDAEPCVVFSVKEAFYKAVYPQLQRILEFHDVEVRLDAGRFAARLVVPDRRIPALVEGRFAIGPERVISVVTL